MTDPSHERFSCIYDAGADPCRVIVTGEVDLSSSSVLTAVGMSALDDERVPDLVLDLRGVTFIDASGLGSLVAVANCARLRAKALVLTAVPARVARLLDLTDLRSAFVLHSTIDTSGGIQHGCAQR